MVPARQEGEALSASSRAGCVWGAVQQPELAETPRLPRSKGVTVGSSSLYFTLKVWAVQSLC